MGPVGNAIQKVNRMVCFWLLLLCSREMKIYYNGSEMYSK
jgi:hypothetical protein